jgi:hypothetical protein
MEHRAMAGVRISQLLHKLELAGFDSSTLSYRKIWQGAVERRYPAHQERGVWHFEPEDVPAVAAAYGLPRKPRVAVPRSTAATAA